MPPALEDDPFVVYQRAIMAEATAYADSAHKHCRTLGRPLRHDERCALQEMLRRVRWSHPACSGLVLGDYWPQVLEGLTPPSFLVAYPREQRSCSHPGLHMFADEMFSYDPDELMCHVVEAAHTETCAYALGRNLGLTPKEVLLATERYADVARPYRSLVEATRRYNLLTWWFSRTICGQQHRSEKEADALNEQRMRFVLESLTHRPAHLCADPLETLTPGEFILPRGPYRGLGLCSTLLRESLLGEHFAHLSFPENI